MKKIAMTLIAGGLLLTACSESESEGFTSANTPIELSTIDELKRFTCDESLNGIEVFVEEKDASFVCDQEENGTWGWTRSNSSTRDSSTSKYSSSNARHGGSSSSGDDETDPSSSSDVSSSSSMPASSSNPFVDPATIRYGLMTDSRDGQIYKTVTIGTQTWMAQNLNYTPTVVYNQTDEIQRNNWCAGKGVQNRKHGDCATFGKLYTYGVAMDSVQQVATNGEFCNENDWLSDIPCPRQGICPDGWHIPDLTEWKTLALAASIDGEEEFIPDNTVQGYKKSPRNLLGDSAMWVDVLYQHSNITQKSFGFNALPSGYNWSGVHGIAVAAFWSRAEPWSDFYMMIIKPDYAETYRIKLYGRNTYALAIRCIKDTIETDPANLSETVIEPPDFNIDLGPTIIEPGEPQAAITYLNPDIEYGEMTDSRDGQVYKTFTFNNQTWMAQNLNYVYNPGVQSWCGGGYEYKEGDCDAYGRLYTWAAAKGHSDSECGYDHFCRDTTYQGICPDGWYLPSLSQYDTLNHYLADTRILPAGTLLKANSDLWNENGKGLDAIGFSALPAGFYSSTFIRTTEEAAFWTRDQNDEFAAKSVALRAQFDRIDTNHYEHKQEARSVRCIKY